jgi:shikimate kinase
MNERAPIYEGLASYVVEVDNKSVSDIVDEIAFAYDLRSKGANNG